MRTTAEKKLRKRRQSMNKQTRLVVSLLFAVVIILAAAITRFYVSVPKDSGGNIGGEEIDKILASDGNGYSIFSDGVGGCGIAEAGRIVAAPEWATLSFAGNEKCIASKKIGGRVKYGCIDFEGNIVVPLIYSRIDKKILGGVNLYRAVSDEDESCVLYNPEFIPYFNVPWKSCEIKGEELILDDDSGSYVYISGSEGLLFKSAFVTGSISNRPYELNIYSRVLLSKLTPMMIEEMAEGAGKYIEYAFSGDESLMSDMSGNIRNFEKLFPDSEEITLKRLISVPEIYIYAVGSEDGMPLYEVSVTVEAEIRSTDEYGESGSFRDELKAAVRFRGSSESTLQAISGAFELKYPEYPVEEIPTEAVSEYSDSDVTLRTN